LGKNKVRKTKKKSALLKKPVTKEDLKRGKSNLYILVAMIIAACGFLFYGLGM